MYRATCSSVYAADGKTPTGNLIHAVLAPYTYDGAPPCPFSTLIDDAGAAEANLRAVVVAKGAAVVPGKVAAVVTGRAVVVAKGAVVVTGRAVVVAKCAAVVAGAAEVGLLVVAPPTSVTWLPAPERSIHRLLLLFQESAV